MLELASDILLSPQNAFRRLQDRPQYLAILTAQILVPTLTVAVFFSRVDLAWFNEVLRGMGKSNAAATFTISREMLLIPAVVASAISNIAFFFLLSVYLQVMARMLGSNVPINVWVAAVTWSFFPSFLAALIPLGEAPFSSNHLISPDQLQPLAIAAIVPHDYFPRWLGNVGSATILSLWSFILLVVAMRTYSNRSILVCTGVAFVPFAVLLAISSLLSLLR